MTMERARRYLDPALFFLALALAWEYGVRLFGIKSYLLPPISAVLASFWENRALLWQHGVVTAVEVVGGFAMAVVVGALIGVWSYFSRTAQRTVYPLVTAMQGLPKIALAPILIVWLGYGTISKVVMAFLFAFFPIVIATLGGLAATPEPLEEHFRALRASAWTTFWRLRVPNALPAFVDGCKVTMPLAVIGAIVGEFVGAEQGLGYLILFANNASRTDLVFAALLAVTLVALLLYAPIQLLGRFIWWRAL
jgi:NitT/TauT family transport system permease protein